MRIRPRLTLLLAALVCALALGAPPGRRLLRPRRSTDPRSPATCRTSSTTRWAASSSRRLTPVTEAVLAADTTLPGDGSFSFVVPPALMTAGFKVRFTDPAKVFTTAYFPNAATFAAGSLFPADTFGTQRLTFVHLATALRGTLSGTVQNTAGPAWRA